MISPVIKRPNLCFTIIQQKKYENAAVFQPCALLPAASFYFLPGYYIIAFYEHPGNMA